MENAVTIFNPQTAIERRRELSQMPAVKRALEPVEQTIFMASTEKPFAMYGGELATEMAKALKFIAKDVGYRETDQNERNYLVVRICEIVKRYYETLSMRDFRLAFEMSITGELDEYLPKGRDGQADRGHYQQFNAEYVCKILNAYRIKRGYVLKKAADAAPKPVAEQDMQKCIESRNATKRDCIEAFNYYRDHGQLPSMSPIAEMLYYQLLSDVGLAPEIEVTEEELRQILRKAIDGFLAKGYTGDANALKEAGTKADEIQYPAYQLARRGVLIKTFERIKTENIDITDYIKFE